MLCIEIIAYFTLTNRIEHDNRTMYTNHTWKKNLHPGNWLPTAGHKKNGVKRQKRGKNVETEKNNAKVCFQIRVALVFRIFPSMTSIYIVICLTFFFVQIIQHSIKEKAGPQIFVDDTIISKLHGESNT